MSGSSMASSITNVDMRRRYSAMEPISKMKHITIDLTTFLNSGGHLIFSFVELVLDQKYL